MRSWPSVAGRIVVSTRSAIERYTINTDGTAVQTMHAPVTGELIAELIVDGRTSLDISALALSRFRTGQLVREHNVI